MRVLALNAFVGALVPKKCEDVTVCEPNVGLWPVLRERLEGVSLRQGVPKTSKSYDLITADLATHRTAPKTRVQALLSNSKKFDPVSILLSNPQGLSHAEGREWLHAQASDIGFDWMSWRSINTRSLGLPHDRVTEVVILSRRPEWAEGLHATLNQDKTTSDNVPSFYWHTSFVSLRHGFCPALRATSDIPTPPAVYFSDCLGKMTSSECLRVQGFDPANFWNLEDRAAYRIAALSSPAHLGDLALKAMNEEPIETPSIQVQDPYEYPAGLYGPDSASAYDHDDPHCSNLSAFLDTKRTPLSKKASVGFLRRLSRTSTKFSDELLDVLETHADRSIEQIAADDGRPEYRRASYGVNLLDSLTNG